MPEARVEVRPVNSGTGAGGDDIGRLCAVHVANDDNLLADIPTPIPPAIIGGALPPSNAASSAVERRIEDRAREPATGP